MAKTEDQKSKSGNQRLLHHGRSSLRVRMVQPVVLKQDSVFLLCTETGDIDPESEQGLYFHDMRYLSRQQMKLKGTSLISLLADASEGSRAIFQLTNHDIESDDGHVSVAKESLGIKREKRLGDKYTESITIQNFTRDEVELVLHLEYDADFADIFVIRGSEPEQRGQLQGPSWSDETLTFEYEGADHHRRRTELKFDPKPQEREERSVAYKLKLGAEKIWNLTVTVGMRDAGSDLEGEPRDRNGSRDSDKENARNGAMGGGTRVTTSNALVNAVLTRSFLDLHMLRMQEKQHSFFAAGVPWYVALFGRDSLVTSIQMLAFEPDIAANTLRILAANQGDKVDDWRDEQPGKILHEMRVDEMANLQEIPQTAYYGSIDSTLLFLILLGRHFQWTGSTDLLHELRDNVDAALSWLDQYGDSDGDGFVDYKTRSDKGLRNQGWKDSGNGIVMEDGSLAEPPIALPEVQGDAYLALTLTAELFENDGDADRAGSLREKARKLYDRFNREFWLPDSGFYALCRQADGRFSSSIASNAAHALWTGIVDPDHASAIAERILHPDMFSGWGIRTLSADDPSYNPVDYQVGSIWPHDNAFIVGGLSRYGLNEAAQRIFKAILDAAVQFEHFRLPETFAGYSRSEASRPVKYPVACNPQAWAAGSIPFMLVSCLGLRPDASSGRLTISKPSLPEWLDHVSLHGLRVGESTLDLTFWRIEHDTLARVDSKQGDLKVVLEY